MLDFNNLTNKQGLISFGGEVSTNYGMVVLEPPVRDVPVRQQTVFNIPGRNGSVIFQDKTFNDTVRTYKVGVFEDTQYDSGGQAVSGSLAERIAAISSWLNSKDGYQMLSDNFEPDYYRMAYYSGGNDWVDKLTMYGEAELTFTCKAQRFLTPTVNMITSSPATIKNPTKFESKPLIKITATNQTVSVTINGKTITAEVADYIYIDCELMNAYRLATENKNDKISGDFPTIAPGNNTVTITGTFTNVQIQPNYYVI